MSPDAKIEKCRLYLPVLWQLSIIPSCSGYWLRNVLLTTAVCFCIILISLTFLDSSPGDNTRVAMDTTHSAVIPTATNKKNHQLNYGVVVDCGSSGSRVFVYFWPPHDGSSNDLLNIQPMMDEVAKPVVKKIEPGISSLSSEPHSASDYLRPLLEFAAEKIPTEKHKETPLYIMATAGMRMLSAKQQQDILVDLQTDVPSLCDFVFSDTNVEVISGKQEGVYAWVAINLALGKFDHSIGDDPLSVVDLPDGRTHIRKRTVGVLDMGGGSLQVAFEVPQSVSFDSPKADLAKSMLAEFNLGCSRSDADHQYRVYVATFLGFGANTVRKVYEQSMVSAVTPQNNRSSPGMTPDSPLADPCLLPNQNEQLLTDQGSLYLRGTGDLSSCLTALKPYLNTSAPCLVKPCSLNGVYQPSISQHASEFYGFAEFFYTMEDILRLGGQYNHGSFLSAAKTYCETQWSAVESWREKGLHPRADLNRYRLQCFKSAWLSLILHEGLGFPRQYGGLTSVQYIEGQEVHWTRGALLYKTRFYPLREIEKHTSHSYQPPWMVRTLTHTYSLLVLCILVVALSICLYVRRLRLVTSRGLRKVPTMSYFMTEEGQMEEGLKVEKSTFYTSSGFQ